MFVRPPLDFCALENPASAIEFMPYPRFEISRVRSSLMQGGLSDQESSTSFLPFFFVFSFPRPWNPSRPVFPAWVALDPQGTETCLLS